MRKIAIVGTGPMAAYLLKHLTADSTPLSVDVFETCDVAGTGMPYREGMNADHMLCNAFSREIPPLTRSLIDWLKSRPSRELNAWELSSHDLSARAFYPRVLIGEYLQSEWEALCEKARASGHHVTVRTDQTVTDILPGDAGIVVESAAESGTHRSRYDDVVIATGHSWPEQPSIDEVDLVSPWPYANITRLPAGVIGVLGSSLSAIDVVVTLGFTHGTFEEDDERVRWRRSEDSEALRISMVSHLGIMPEGDFYYPFPYTPLTHLTEDAVVAEVARGPEGLLERVFQLLCQDLDESDPDYLSEDARSLSGFAPAYFARRQELGGLPAVKRDLAKTRESIRRKQTVPHRYVLLRGHEAFDHALRHLTEDDYAAFLEHLMPVFGDCYAAVPHLSLARIVALYDAGVLELHATGQDSSFRQAADGAIEVATEDGTARFDHMVDARGQAPASVSGLPFPTLAAAVTRGEAPVTAPFTLELAGSWRGRVYCLALPQVLERHPFSQGLPNCSELAAIVARDLL